MRDALIIGLIALGTLVMFAIPAYAIKLAIEGLERRDDRRRHDESVPRAKVKRWLDRVKL